MTIEEAIAQLKMDRNLCNFNPMTGEEEPMNEDCRKSVVALDIAIKALEQEPCEDAVSRKAVINEIFYSTDNNGDVVLASSLRERIARLSSVTLQEPKTGTWITKIKSDLRGDMWPTNPKCSECGGEPYFSNTIYNYKFCPYCGAKMAENEEDKELIVNKDVYDTLTEEQKKLVDIGLSYFNNRRH